MTEMIVTIIGFGLLIYGLIGLIFGLIFITFWIASLDHAAKDGSLGFRLILLPGLAALWPLFLLKIGRSSRSGSEPPQPEKPISPGQLRQNHGTAFLVLAVLVPLLIFTTLWVRKPPASFSEQVPFALQPPEPLPETTRLRLPANFPLPVQASLRWSRDKNGRQLELQVRRALARPAVALYWSGINGALSLPGDAVFLGTVWGPSVQRYTLPDAAQTSGGAIYFLSWAQGQDMLGNFPLTSP